jgi:hypothetical protein
MFLLLHLAQRCFCQSVYQRQQAFCVDDSNLDDLMMNDDMVFDGSVVAQLAALGRQLPSTPCCELSCCGRIAIKPDFPELTTLLKE